ncbi:hypothetical protein RFUL19S_04992 [Rhizobacter fulvus]
MARLESCHQALNGQSNDDDDKKSGQKASDASGTADLSVAHDLLFGDRLSNLKGYDGCGKQTESFNDLLRCISIEPARNRKPPYLACDCD